MVMAAVASRLCVPRHISMVSKASKLYKEVTIFIRKKYFFIISVTYHKFYNFAPEFPNQINTNLN